MLWVIVSWILLGLIAGAVARLLVPGRDPMSIPATILLGVVGSFVGGLLGYVLFGKDLGEGALQPSGIIGSIVGAIVVLLIFRATMRRGTGRRTSGRRTSARRHHSYR
ncbi:GlsB/YeaQ/YmgE family stress response membrane protein [Frankia sp. CNm7]|uniref:GlsB/YeaQ/YmgE family stress response membrane protein n=1 Tax=Frankia nepalensis TaxID=1836974 RepID=A0A937RAD5_9ACTN|nr:GlsB/YeaQ/YmgE family stress response membrane protein [Frankia nepalensis]MBL7500910.1 GlsB/YeaQ/YmgE family stress response membrane protein [Frankia nepalensis]MBL7510339.1 GlsB/YeaQ/YmgE family stress response membrane protein [Frankia nepalensis]MBL7519225.1 GlsB/YeaQ/YmgE family stress response membrane protein [Frankia nepalensis]MBL7626677.1 GlsB/YeaQ/YmgE family stress response membrane protein [Frankia nepalensis]